MSMEWCIHFTIGSGVNSSMSLTRFYAKTCFLLMNGVRGSLDSMETRGGGSEYPGRQRADGSYGDFGAKKAAINIHAKRVSPKPLRIN